MDPMSARNHFIVSYTARKRLFSLILVLVFILGCGGPAYYTRPNADIKNIKRIAVLPLENLTAKKYAGEKVRRILITELLKRDIEVIEPGEVTRAVQELRISSISSIKIDDIKKIGERLGVKVLMMGSVEAFEVSRGISFSYPEVSINLRIIEVSSGFIIWSASHTAGGPSFWTRHFGAEVATLSETARKAVKEAISTIF